MYCVGLTLNIQKRKLNMICIGTKLLLAVLLKCMTASLETLTHINRLKPNGNYTNHLL